jgi:hypothetical protein
MAVEATVVCTEKRGSVTGDVYEPGSVYVRTFTFPVLGSATGFGDTDSVALVTIPAETQILSIAAKSSVAQTNSTTLAFNHASNAAGGSGAFATTAALTTTLVPCELAVASQDVATTGASDSVLSVTFGAGTCVAGTITVSMVCAALGSASAPFTTYTN